MKTGWNHNIHYHDFILRAVPSPCGRALNAGCGQGLLTRQLATRAKTVTGIDLDPPSETSAPPNTTFVQGDIMTHPFPPASFDFIAAVATLHHLPLQPALARFRDLLAPGGVLAILGLYRPATLTDYALAAARPPPQPPPPPPPRHRRGPRPPPPPHRNPPRHPNRRHPPSPRSHPPPPPLPPLYPNLEQAPPPRKYVILSEAKDPCI